MNLETKYLGLDIKNPVIAGASLLTEDLANLKAMEKAGAGAVVLGSLFEEQIIDEENMLDHFFSGSSESFAEAVTYFPRLGEYRSGPEQYLDFIRKAKGALSIPVIASLNGVSTGGWVKIAGEIEKAGADALELNIYFIPTRLDQSSEQIESVYIDTVRSVKRSVKIPVAVKVSPYFSNFANMAGKLHDAGADGLVLFNRFYQPDFNIDDLYVEPRLTFSSSSSLGLTLRWIAILHGRIDVDFSATNGVHTSQDVIKAIMAGANSVQVCAALYKNGVDYIKDLVDGLSSYLSRKGYGGVGELKGILSQKECAAPDAFERANYIKTLIGFRN